MSTGFLAVNNNNQVLVSTDTRNLHFIGKAAYIGNQGHDYYGGLCRFRFKIASKVAVVPFFTLPTSDLHAVTSVKKVADEDAYEIELIRSGTQLATNVPEVYVFADPRALSSTETHGLVVYQSDGTPAFDSRLKPLTITDGAFVTHPSNPRNAAIPALDPKNCNTTLKSAFTPDAQNIFFVGQGGIKEIFSYVSLTQAQRQANFYASEEECDGFDAYGNCVGARRKYEWNSRYWAFYRGGIMRQLGGGVAYMAAGWICVNFGCNWDYRSQGSFLGIGTGGNSGTGGTWPYENETINLSSTPILVANGSRYD